MILLPDTNAWIRFLNPGENLLKEKLLSADPAIIRLCSIVKAELYYGAVNSSRSAENLNLLEALFARFTSLPFDDAAARKYGEVRFLLSRQGKLIGPNDLLIASIAVVHKATVITHNTREFKRVDDLKVEDWE